MPRLSLAICRRATSLNIRLLLSGTPAVASVPRTRTLFPNGAAAFDMFVRFGFELEDRPV